MKRIKQAYIVAKETISKGDAKYNYRYGFIWTALLLLGGFFLDNILGNILIILGLFMSPLLFWLNGFWMFVISLIKPIR